MNDQEILDFIDFNGIQCWPEWTPDHQVKNWIAQNRKPFLQCSRKTLRAAVVDLSGWMKEGGAEPKYSSPPKPSDLLGSNPLKPSDLVQGFSKALKKAGYNTSS